MTRFNTILHDFSGKHNDGGGRFVCSVCFNEMHTEDGGPSCGHPNLTQYNPIITWEGVKDWLDALRAEYSLGPLGQQDSSVDWQLRDARLLSLFLKNELTTQAEIESIYRLSFGGAGLPQNILNTKRLSLLRESSQQKVSALEGAIQFGVSA